MFFLLDSAINKSSAKTSDNFFDLLMPMVKLMKYLRGLLIFVFVAAVACGDDDSPGEENESENNSEVNNTENHGEDYDGPTYYGDIEPMMQTHCTGCHIPDDIAPFPLETYEEVKATSAASHVTMTQGTMPPWPPDDECADFKDHRGMSAEEIETFADWMAADHPEGEPESGGGGHNANSVDIDGEPDTTLDWGFDYDPQPPGEDSIDDYRCFVIDPDIDEDKFVNLVHTRPDNAEIVHHMIAYSAPADSADELADLEGEDDRPGYECFGGPRVSDAMWLSAWAPGEVPTRFEDGHGIRLEEDDKIVVQMHYNMVNDPEGVDRTELDLYFLDDDEDPTELTMVPLPATDLHLEAGDPEAEAYVEGPEIPLPITVHGIFPHMHLLGTEIRVNAKTNDGDVCLIDVPSWDFDWQGFYMYEEPIELAAPSTVEMTCVYDNSADNQAPGRTPQDVYWGDGTYDEMCLAIFVLELPPGFEDLL